MPPGNTFHLTCLAFALGQLLAVPSQAAVITVNSVLDDGSDGSSCTLREAIANANNDNNGDGNGCEAGSGTDDIEFDLALPDTTTLTAALPTISTTMNVDGPGTTQLTVDGAGSG